MAILKIMRIVYILNIYTYFIVTSLVMQTIIDLTVRVGSCLEAA